MTPQTIRRGLLVLTGAVVLAVVASLRRGPAAPPAPATSTAPLAGTAGEDLVYRKIVDGKERGLVKAKAFVGQDKEGTRLKSVEATFDHVYEGKPGKTTIVADECLYDAEKQKASFKGNVKVTTSEGLELTSASLIYNGSKELVKSEEKVEFRRAAVSGRSVGMTYEAGGGQLVLDREVFLRIEHAEGSPTEVRSGTATASRSEAMMKFAEGVEVTRGEELLKAQRLNINLSPDLAFVYRAVAVDDMELRGSSSEPGASPKGPEALRVLRGRKLDLWFHEDTHKLREAMAGPDASLSFPSKAGEGRALTARFINLKFDGQGRLEEIQGLRDAVLEAAPGKKGKAGGRTVKCFTLIGKTDPATGELVDMDFQGGVEIFEPKRRATAHGGRYQERGQVLSLAVEAHLVDEAQGSDLAADGIELQGSGNVAARENIRHLVTPRGKGGPFGGDRVWQVRSRFFDYDASQKTGRYREHALLRAGDDEVRGALIVVDEAKPGQRRLNASGGVTSILHARRGKEPADPKAPRRPIETESAEMVYEESKSTVVYTGDVRIRQGDVTTRSPEATAFLSADGSRLERVVAGEPVEVRQGLRRANGTRGTYTPENETMVLVGEKVVLEDPQQRLQGRSLTFHAGDDTILVDGREVERTESVFRRKQP